MNITLDKPQPRPHLKVTIGITLVVALFFAFRAEAQDIDMNTIDSSYSAAWLKEGVPAAALKKALNYEMHDPHLGDKKKEITNKEWLVIIDYTAPSTRERLFVLNLKTGVVMKSYVAHGKGSDDGTGKYAVRFSNKNDTHATSPGFLRIGNHINSPAHGPAFYLEGLEDRNSAVGDRDIILHSAKYVSADFVQEHGYTGRSWGCPAVSPEMLKVLYSKNIPGSLLYGYTSQDARTASTQE